MRITAWHGTNQDFEAFSPSPPARATHGVSAPLGTFLTLRRDTAEQYARNASRRLHAGSHEGLRDRVADLVARAERASRRRDFDAGERLIAEAERLETESRADDSCRLLRVSVDVENPLVIPDVGHIDLREMVLILERAWAEGRDAVILENVIDVVTDVAPGRDDHVIVRDPAAIRIIGREELIAENEAFPDDDVSP